MSTLAWIGVVGAVLFAAWVGWFLWEAGRAPYRDDD